MGIRVSPWGEGSFDYEDILALHTNGSEHTLTSFKEGYTVATSPETDTGTHALQYNGIKVGMPKFYLMGPNEDTTTKKYVPLSYYDYNTGYANLQDYDLTNLLPYDITISSSTTHSISRKTRSMATSKSLASFFFSIYDHYHSKLNSQSYGKYTLYEDSQRFMIETDGPAIFVPMGDDFIGMGHEWHLVSGPNVNESGRMQSRFEIKDVYVDNRLIPSYYTESYQDRSNNAESATDSKKSFREGMAYAYTQRRYCGPGLGCNRIDLLPGEYAGYDTVVLSSRIPRAIFFNKCIHFLFSYVSSIWFNDNSKQITLCLEKICPRLEGLIYKLK